MDHCRERAARWAVGSSRQSPRRLGSLKVLLEKEEIVQKGLRQTLNATDARWLLGELPDWLTQPELGIV